MRDGQYELDLVLRNNITTAEHPMGVYHPHGELHHIKKENIGLIEVMGLAVLPARLKGELKRLGEVLVQGGDPAAEPELAKHGEWAAQLRERHTFTPENVDAILRDEVGRGSAAAARTWATAQCPPPHPQSPGRSPPALQGPAPWQRCTAPPGSGHG